MTQQRPTWGDTEMGKAVRECLGRMRDGQVIVVRADVVYGRTRIAVQLGQPTPMLRERLREVLGLRDGHELARAIVFRDLHGDLHVHAVDQAEEVLASLVEEP